MYKLVVTGFNTKAEAEAFYSYYEGAGEQDACRWFECRKEEGEIEVDSMMTDMSFKPYWDGDSFVFKVKPQ